PPRRAQRAAARPLRAPADDRGRPRAAAARPVGLGARDLRDLAAGMSRGSLLTGGTLVALAGVGLALSVGSHGSRPALAPADTVARAAPMTTLARQSAARRLSVAEQRNVYAHDAASSLTGAARFARPLVYVPNSESASVDVIDPHTLKVVARFPV